MNILRKFLPCAVVACFSVIAAVAQTSVFSYQGKLTDGGVPANGSYDMRFRLFDAATGGAQVGSDVTINGVQAAGGIFKADLDFGTSPFSGADRFLEVALSQAGQNNFTVLAPRQRLTSAPYAVKAVAADTASNSLSLGGLTPGRFVQISADGNVGIGTTTPTFKLHVVDTSNQGLRVQTNALSGTVASFGGFGAFQVDAVNVPGGRLTILENGNVGINRINPAATLHVTGTVIVGSFPGSGTTPICFAITGLLATCSSSLRYKTDIASFNSGLNLVKRLRPVSFIWKDGTKRDLGLIAEEVEQIEPLLATYNDKGEIEGVRYNGIGVVLVNAVKEQQALIEAQQKEIDDNKKLNQSLKERFNDQQERLDKQQTEIEALKKLICLQNPTAEVCGKNR